MVSAAGSLLLCQVGQTAKKLQSCDGEAGTLRRFSSEKCRDIDLLEREAVLHKMGELSVSAAFSTLSIFPSSFYAGAQL